MKVQTPIGELNTDGPIKCKICRRMFFGPNKPGKLTIGKKVTFICNQHVVKDL